MNTKVNLCGIELDNPIIPASGTFGFGYEFAELYDINMLGTFSFKGTTKDPRFGNPTPRIAECTAGMINAVGLQNPGVEKVIAEELPKLKKCFHKPVMANISGFSVEDYAYTCEKLDKEEQVGWLEVNVSCPNVHGGGMSFGTDPKAAGDMLLPNFAAGEPEIPREVYDYQAALWAAEREKTEGTYRAAALAQGSKQ